LPYRDSKGSHGQPDTPQGEAAPGHTRASYPARAQHTWQATLAVAAA
jgi:hypothetical protein